MIPDTLTQKDKLQRENYKLKKTEKLSEEMLKNALLKSIEKLKDKNCEN